MDAAALLDKAPLLAALAIVVVGFLKYLQVQAERQAVAMDKMLDRHEVSITSLVEESRQKDAEVYDLQRETNQVLRDNAQAVGENTVVLGQVSTHLQRIEGQR